VDREILRALASTNLGGFKRLLAAAMLAARAQPEDERTVLGSCVAVRPGGRRRRVVLRVGADCFVVHYQDEGRLPDGSDRTGEWSEVSNHDDPLEAAEFYLARCARIEACPVGPPEVYRG